MHIDTGTSALLALEVAPVLVACAAAGCAIATAAADNNNEQSFISSQGFRVPNHERL